MLYPGIGFVFGTNTEKNWTIIGCLKSKFLYTLILVFFRFHRKKEQAYTLAYCNSKIKDATEFLLDKNMTQAYLSLAEVLKKVHMSEEHKELQQQALDIVITSLGISPYQGKLMFHSKGRFEKLHLYLLNLFKFNLLLFF